ncbi:MAG: hypothetical protein JWN26_647 [Candidatus Saccharibacteria bacterium]|nr:hypothetical protein [Candidatus Saccharibacteria bacterium]
MGTYKVIKLVIDGAINSKIDDANKAHKVVSLAIGATEIEQYLPFEIRRKLGKRVKVVHEGKTSFDKALAYFAYDGALVITFTPYRETPRYVEKLRTLLGGEVYERINAIARGNLRLGGTILRSIIVTKEFTPHEIEAIVAYVSNAKPVRLAATA